MRLSGRLTEIVERQHGIVSRQQVLRAGCSVDWLRARIDSSEWRRVFAATYATFSGPLTSEAMVAAAVVRAGPGAMAAEVTALWLYGVVSRATAPPLVVLLPSSRRIIVERAITVRYSDHADARRHPLWTPPRTYLEDAVLDLAARCRRLTDVAGWVTKATTSGLTSPERIALALSQRPRHRWRSELEPMLTEVRSGAQSPLELRYLRRVERGHRLPSGLRQHRFAAGPARYADIDYEPFRTRVELDGRLGHVGDGVFRDRLRDNASTREGLVTLRYGWGEVFDDPCAIAHEVGSVLRSRGWTGQPRSCGPLCSVPGP